MKEVNIKLEYSIGNLVFTLIIPQSVQFLLNSYMDPDDNCINEWDFKRLSDLKASLKKHLHELWYEVTNTKVIFPDYPLATIFYDTESNADRYLRISDVVNRAVHDIEELERIYNSTYKKW